MTGYSRTYPGTGGDAFVCTTGGWGCSYFSSNGGICLDILKEKWSAVYNVRTILLSIQSLLGEPNNQSPLNAQAAQLWENQEDYKKTLHKKYREDTK